MGVFQNKEELCRVYMGTEYIHTYIHTYMHTYIHTCIHTYIHTYRHTYKHTYIHTYIHNITLHYITSHYITLHYITLHTYVHTYIYIYMLRGLYGGLGKFVRMSGPVWQAEGPLLSAFTSLACGPSKPFLPMNF